MVGDTGIGISVTTYIYIALAQTTREVCDKTLS